MFETLESRCLMTAVTAASDSFGNLTVTGTTGNDTIKVTEKSGSASVYSGTTLIGTFANVKACTINPGAGNDTVTYSGYDFGATVNDGAGSDTVNVTDYAPSTAVHSTINGNTGVEKIYVFSAYGATIHAGTGGANTISLQGGSNMNVYTNGNGYVDTISLSSPVSGCHIYADKTDKITNLGTANTITLS